MSDAQSTAGVKCHAAGCFAAPLSFALGCVSPVDRFAVVDADLVVGHDVVANVDEAWAGRGEKYFGLELQRIGRGPHIVISKRTFDEGSAFVMDSQNFEMITIVLPEPDSTQVFDLARDPVSVVYSAGTPSFPDMACFSYAVAGTVSVHRKENAFRVALSAKLAPGPSSSPYSCSPAEVSDEGIFKIVPLGELPPWLGGPSDDPRERAWRY